MPTNYKEEWSYTNSDGKFCKEYDLFFECSAKNAVKRVYDDYSQYSDLRIQYVWKECADCWEEIDSWLWEE